MSRGGVTLHLQPIRIAGADGEGVLVFSEEKLVAVLSRLSDLHDGDAGQWFLEAGFGELDQHKPELFVDLDAAQDWISRLIKD